MFVYTLCYILPSFEYQFKVLFYFYFNILVLSFAAAEDTATESAVKTTTDTAAGITTLPPPQIEITTGISYITCCTLYYWENCNLLPRFCCVQWLGRWEKITTSSSVRCINARH